MGDVSKQPWAKERASPGACVCACVPHARAGNSVSRCEPQEAGTVVRVCDMCVGVGVCAPSNRRPNCNTTTHYVISSNIEKVACGCFRSRTTQPHTGLPGPESVQNVVDVKLAAVLRVNVLARVVRERHHHPLQRVRVRVMVSG